MRPFPYFKKRSAIKDHQQVTDEHVHPIHQLVDLNGPTDEAQTFLIVFVALNDNLAHLIAAQSKVDLMFFFKIFKQRPDLTLAKTQDFRTNQRTNGKSTFLFANQASSRVLFFAKKQHHRGCPKEGNLLKLENKH